MTELLIQGALAAILLLGMVTVIVIELVRGQPVSVPDALTLAVGTVVGFFFGARSVRTGQQAANDTVRAVRETPAGAQTEESKGQR